MKKSKAYPGLVGLLGAAVLVAGCGSGQKAAALPTVSPSASGGASSSSSGSATPSVAASAAATTGSGTPVSGFPGFTLPADLKVTIDSDTTGDPVKDKILADNASVIMTYIVAGVTGNPNASGISTYLWTLAQADLDQATTAYHNSGKSPTGSVRYYARKVPALSGDSARVVWCADDRQAADKDASGRVIPGSTGGFDFWSADVKKDAAGVWQATALHETKDSTLCASAR
jgi:hypothetical protein